MSDHELPEHLRDWPRDPFRLLGVERGVSARDLRKAYLRLIRTYKPEHAPDAFQKIREAYDSALPFCQARDQGQNLAFEIPPDFEPPLEPEPEPVSMPDPTKFAIPPDPWQVACQGDQAGAYQILADRGRLGVPGEETYLQLYWLLSLVPGLDPSRSPVDWLIRGLIRSGGTVPRLRELLRRSMLADPSLTQGDRLEVFLRDQHKKPALAVDVAEARWRVARAARRWDLIRNDLERLRSWVPDLDRNAWVRLLIAGASNFAWANDQEAEFADRLVREAETFDENSDNLYQVEYAQVVKAGLDRVGGCTGPHARIFELLADSWEEPDTAFRARVRNYLDQTAGDPTRALRDLDQIQAAAPAVLGRLTMLIGGVDREAPHWFDPRFQAEIAIELERLLSSVVWTDYPIFRRSLLKFCLEEMVSPGLVARILAGQPQFIMTGKAPLAHAIIADEPLRHVYRAAEIAQRSLTA